MDLVSFNKKLIVADSHKLEAKLVQSNAPSLLDKSEMKAQFERVQDVIWLCCLTDVIS